MYQPNFKVELNSYFQNISKRVIPKFVLILFHILFFVFGLDFGFNNVFNKQSRIYLKLLSTIVSILVFVYLLTPMYMLFYGFDLMIVGFHGIGCLQYTIHVLLLYKSRYNVYHFVFDMYKIHNKIYDNEYIFLSCVLAYNLITYVLKLIYCHFLCKLKLFECVTISNTVPMFAYCLPILALDIVAVVQIVIYYYVQASLKFMRHQMENNNIDLIIARRQFIMIADCCDKVSALYKKLVSILGG